MARLVSNRYASALIESGIELGKVNEFKKELEYIRDLFNEEKQALQLLSHPRISRKEKKDFILSIFQGHISQEMINFFYILIDKNRERVFLEIAEEYENLYYEYENILKVKAITAMPMDNEAMDRLKAVLKEKFNKNIEISNEIDNSILGGVLLKVGNKIIDGTIKGQLELMGKTIKGVSL